MAIKRQDTANWTIQIGNVTGHRHLASFTNGQDAAGVTSDDALDSVGATVCDGCGSSPRSEVGANLISAYLVKQISTLFGRGCSPDCMPPILFSAVIDYIQMQLHLNCQPMNLEERARMINDFWLCSICGLAMNNKRGCVFWSGDPTFAIDDELVVIDEDNKPSYVAYKCLGDPSRFGVSESHIPTQFNTLEFDPSKVSKIMISSDGFTSRHPQKFAKAQERENLPKSLHGSQWGIRGKVGLQLWMNRYRDRGYFDDDCGMVIVERKTNA